MKVDDQNLYQSSFIHGEFLSDAKENQFSVLNKNDSSVLQKLSFIDETQLEEVIKSTKKGFESMQKLSAQKRADLLNSLASKLKEMQEVFANLICLEAGKPISYSKVEVQRAIGCLEIAAKECLRQKIKEHDLIEGKRTFFKRFILAPVLGITPFNFPLNLMVHKIAPALAVGSSILIKPSLYTPLTALLFAKIIDEVGFPKGSVNIVLCQDKEAEKLVKSSEFSMLSFTGSAKIGWMLKDICGKKKVCLELGGNAPVIIHDGDNLGEIAQTVLKGCFLYAGQICISTQKILVHEKIYKEFKEKLLEYINIIQSDLSTQQSSINGPLIDSNSLKRIDEMVKSSGGEILCGGNILDQQANIYAPTIIEKPQQDSLMNIEEVFGPVAILNSYSDFQEAVSMANKSKYGLQVGVYASHQQHIDYAFEHLEYAGVIINNIPGYRDDNMPYGGVKDSGFGREGIAFAMKEMTELKLMVI